MILVFGIYQRLKSHIKLSLKTNFVINKKNVGIAAPKRNDSRIPREHFSGP